jgi:hypothetical protein
MDLSLWSLTLKAAQNLFLVTVSYSFFASTFSQFLVTLALEMLVTTFVACALFFTPYLYFVERVSKN